MQNLLIPIFMIDALPEMIQALEHGFAVLAGEEILRPS
jgi:hypothetical protein